MAVLHLVKKLLQWFNILFFACYGATMLVFIGLESARVYLDVGFEWAGRFGQWALVVYIMTLIPGMVTRFGLAGSLGVVNRWLVPIRRELGIMTFGFAIAHASFIKLMPWFLMFGLLPLSSLVLSDVFGVSALIILFFLWLTSNDYSVKKLGKFWKRLHRFTYLALFLILAHVAFFNQVWAVVLLAVAVLQVASWISFWSRQKVSNQEPG